MSFVRKLLSTVNAGYTVNQDFKDLLNEAITLGKTLDEWLDDEPFLFRLVQQDAVEHLQEIFRSQVKYDVNLKAAGGMTLLHSAWSDEVVELLLDAGADVNAHNDRMETPLYNIIVRQDDEDGRGVQLLLDAGADVSVADAVGRTPLHVAHTPAIVDALLQKQTYQCPMILYENLRRAF